MDARHTRCGVDIRHPQTPLRTAAGGRTARCGQHRIGRAPCLPSGRRLAASPSLHPKRAQQVCAPMFFSQRAALQRNSHPDGAACPHDVSKNGHAVFRPQVGGPNGLRFATATTGTSSRPVFAFRAAPGETPSPPRSCSRATWRCRRVPVVLPGRRRRR